jgi:hypothetical protein
MLSRAAATAALILMSSPPPRAANAAVADCMGDCLKNCRLVAPNNDGYCRESCDDYCSQTDRTDGLSGSVSAASGEVGILGGAFGTGTVIKGEDKPPVINVPGLDFLSGQGRKVIGYYEEKNTGR